MLGRWQAIERPRMDDTPGALDVDERAELERLRREVAADCPANRLDRVAGFS